MNRLATFAALPLLACLAAPAAAAPWSRAFVVEWIEPATHFGAPPGSGVEAPGTDCPRGAEPELDFDKLLKIGGRTEADVARIRNPENQMLAKNMGLRGPNLENIYENLEILPDPGMRVVEGKIAEGLNLDGDRRTGFVSPAGERGIDNNYYKAWGCWLMFRGPPRRSFGGGYHNDDMRNGKFTALILLSGTKDPQNDDDVMVGLFASADKIVKDGKGEVAADYSYRIADDPAHSSVLKGRIVEGVLEVAEPQDLRWLESSLVNDLTLYRAKLRFRLRPDGALEGLVGGYRPIREAIDTWIKGNPTGVELVSHVNLSAAWYAIKRQADARPDPKSGENTAISTAIRYSAVPAFAILPDGTGEARAASAVAFKTAAPARD